MADAQFAEDHLRREDHAGDGGVECGGDAARGSASDEGADADLRHAEGLPQRRAKRRTDLHDGPLPADRTACAECEGRCHGLDDHHNRPDAAAAQGDGLHHLRHAVPLGLAGVTVDERAGDQPTQGRDSSDQGHAGLWN